MKKFLVAYSVLRWDAKTNKSEVFDERKVGVEANDIWDAIDAVAEKAKEKAKAESNERYVYEIDDTRAREIK